MATLVLYVGFYHSLIYFRMRDKGENLSFALSCFAVGAYCICSAGLYNAATPLEGVNWQRFQIPILSTLAVAVLLFVRDYSGETKTKTDYFFIFYLLITALISLVFRNNFIWSDKSSVKYIDLPFALITYNEMAPGVFVNFLSFIGIIFSFYVFYLCIVFYNRDRKKGLPLILALFLCFIGLVNDIFVNIGLLNFVYIIEYSYIGIIFLFTFFLTDSAILVSKIKEELLKSEKKYRTLFDSSANAIVVINLSDNRIYDCNGATVKLLEKKREELLGLDPVSISPEFQPDGERSADLAEKYIKEAIKKGSKIFEWYHKKQDGNVFPVIVSLTPVFFGGNNMIVAIASDISARKKAEEEKEKLIVELKEALENIKTLSGLLPICARCKKIKDDKGYWKNLEAYIEEHSSASFSHSLCNQCSDELYSNEQWYIDMKKAKGGR